MRCLPRAGLAIDASEFAAMFGRTLEYYTGFVFQIEAQDGTRQSPAAGAMTILSDMGRRILCRRSAAPSIAKLAALCQASAP